MTKLYLRAAILAVGMSSAAFAQQTPGGSGTGLEEIVVTAQRRVQSLGDIPYNLQVISGETLERAAIDSVVDIVRLTPGLSITGTGGRNDFRLTLRGLRTGEEGVTDVTTTTYIDETPIDVPGFATVDLRLLDIERIEVLRGPQGTLYGAGAIGGTLRYISRKPTLDALEGKVTGGLSSTEDGGMNYRGAAMVNVPLVEDRLAVRINAGYEQLDGYIDDIGLGRDDVNDEERIDSRIALRAELSERVSLELTHYHNEGDFGSNSSFDTRFAERTTRYDAADAEDRSIDLFNFTATVNLGFASLTSSTNYADGEIDTSTDETIEIRDVIYASFIDPADLPEIDTLSERLFEADSFSQELRFVSPSDQLVAFVVGGYYARNRGTQDYRDTVANFPFPGQADFESYIGYAIADDTQYTFASRIEREQVAGFAEITFNFRPDWQVTLGGRAFRYETDGGLYAIDNYFGFEARDANGISRTVPFEEEFTFGEAEDDGTIFKVNSSYKFGAGHMVYGTIASGYRPGGFNPVSPATGVTPDQFQYEPDTIVNYEVGARFNLLDRRAYLSTAVYTIDWNDIQTLEQTDLGFGVLGNAGAAQVSGLEIEFNTQDLLAPGLAVGFTYGYIDGELTETTEFLGFDGDRVPFVPQHAASLQFDYRVPLSESLEFGVIGIVSHRGSFFTRFGAVVPVSDGAGSFDAVDNEAFVRIDKSTTLDLAATVSGEAWTARLFADNVFDDEQQSNAEVLVASGPYNSGTIVNRFIGRPRTFGLEASYSW